MIFMYVKLYLLVGMLMAWSVFFKMPWTGSKEDYSYLNYKILENGVGSARAVFCAYSAILVAALLCWPWVLYYRFKDIWKGLA